MDRLKQVGKEIARRRAELGMTQYELRDATGISLRTIGNAEQGKREMTKLNRARIERALSWEPGSLTTAYETGRTPGRAVVQPDDGSTDPVLMEILRADLSDRDKAQLFEKRGRQIADLRSEIARREAAHSGRRAG